MEAIAIITSVAICTGLYSALKALKYFYKRSSFNCKSSCMIEKDDEDDENENNKNSQNSNKNTNNNTNNNNNQIALTLSNLHDSPKVINTNDTHTTQNSQFDFKDEE